MNQLNAQDFHILIVEDDKEIRDGITMTLKLREKYNFPVNMLSAKSEETDKVMGLNIGADDYLTKKCGDYPSKYVR